MNITPNAIYQADCLEILERIASETVTLVYIDPPDYSLEVEPSEDSDGAKFKEGFKQHLVFLSQVFQQSHRILSKSGNLFFHAKPMLAGSVRLILDQVFGRENYRVEFTWPHRSHSIPSTTPRARHDVILLYSKTNEYTFNRQYRPPSKSEIDLRYPNSDERGPFMLTDLTSPVSRPNQQFEWKGITPPKNRSWRYGKEALERLEKEGRIYSSEKGLPKLKVYLEENAGVEIGSVWDDILPLSPAARENLKYPSQKPLALLMRIIQMGSNTHDVVLDPFSGSGTTLAAAQELGRKWIGCDLSEESVSICTKRISEAFRLQPNVDFTIGNGDTLKDVPVAYSLYSPVITGLEDFASLAGKRFVLNQPAPIEETRHFELKEIKGARPVESIVNAADEYAVAFLNSEGGCVFWGVRNEDRMIVGVRLLYEERDRLRRLASEKLNAIKPKIDPTQYRIELHEVYDTDGKTMPDMWVVELKVPRPIFPGPYFTGSNELFAKVDGVKQKLEGPALAEWIMRRQRST